LIKSNYHTHTQYCDGLSDIQEYIDAAIASGFHSLGFSGHGHVPVEGLYAGMSPDATAEYIDKINISKGMYAGKINIYLGLENDSAYLHPAENFDYTIGSVHCIKRGGRHYSVDSKESAVAGAIAEGFGGDGLAYALAYYDAVMDFVSEKRADVLGHIDLVRRFNVKGGFCYFDENDMRYRRAAEAALEKAVASGYIVEVNTAPLSKGVSDEPYPAYFLLERARELGARIIVSSDAHSAVHLAFAFAETESVLKKIGFTERWEFNGDGFIPVAI